MKDVLQANYTCARDPGAAWIPVDAPSCEVKGTLDPGVNEILVAFIPVKKLKKKLHSNAVPVLLDVREPDELTGIYGAIEGIRNIPIGHLGKKLAELEELKNEEIVTVCHTGGRSHTAAQILTKAGFSRVRVLKGGMLAWNQ